MRRCVISIGVLIAVSVRSRREPGWSESMWVGAGDAVPAKLPARARSAVGRGRDAYTEPRREPHNHAEFAQQVLERQVELLVERGIWRCSGRG